MNEDCTVILGSNERTQGCVINADEGVVQALKSLSLAGFVLRTGRRVS